MPTTPQPECPARAQSRHDSRAAFVTFTALVLAVGCIALLARGCASMAGGPVMSASEYRQHVSKTRESGEQAVVQLGFLPDETAVGEDEDTSSCMDGFGFDDEGITRDQPSATWRLHFDSRADYRASVEDLRKGVDGERADSRGRSRTGEGGTGRGHAGIKTSDDAGIELSFGPAWLSGDPELVADGGCVRHRYY